MTGHSSVYPSQVLQVSKSASISVHLGKEIQDIEAEYKPRESTLISLVKTFYKAIAAGLAKKK